MRIRRTAVAAIVTLSFAIVARAQAAGPAERETRFYSAPFTLGESKLVKAEKQYSFCLKSDVDGVVEASLANVAILKLMYPERQFGELCDEAGSIAVKHSSLEMRYKAYLVQTLLQNPKLFAGLGQNSYNTSDELFAALAGRMQGLIAGNLGK